MKRLLCIVSFMNTGGAETFLMKLYRELDKNHYQMDFCICNLEKNFYEDEIQKMGGRIYHLPPKTKHPFLFLYQFCKLPHLSDYNYVLRLGSSIFETGDLYLCWLFGIKIRIFRSCNANALYPNIMIKIHKLLRKFIMCIVNVKIAPSKLAAQFTFGNIKNVHILPNGLDTKAFAFNENSRNKIRKELNTEGKFVVGHIGRFNLQKNHKFLLQIFAEIKKKNKNAELWLIGKGELENEIKEQAKNLNILDNVKLLGIRTDIPELLSGMDIFIFPSLFEGMPNTVIEAQTNGLPCLISDTITSQARQTNLVNFMSLQDTPSNWAEKSLQIADNQTQENRPKAAIQMRKAGYDIKNVIKQFTTLVFGEKNASN